MRRQIVLGNWKMNGDRNSNERLLREFSSLWRGTHQIDVAMCPPFPYLEQTVRELAETEVQVGPQDVSCHSQGAYTGDVSAAMVADMGGRYVILGHSERRQYHGESDELIASKLRTVLDHPLIPVVCVGETAGQRDKGETLAVIAQQLQPGLAKLTAEQLARTIVAYEPLWAIGTGKTASPEQAQEVHAHIRAQLGAPARGTRIVYGGSVKPENADALFVQQDIDGALVGGASLKANEFLAICRAAETSGEREA